MELKSCDEVDTHADGRPTGGRFSIPHSTQNCGRFAQLLQQSRNQSAITVCADSDFVQTRTDIAPCEQCGSPVRFGRGFCLNCVLQEGLESDISNAEKWEDVLEQVDVDAVEWRVGNYQILQKIGRGGMGIIYRARQINPRRIVALKRILSCHADSREALVRFEREIRAIAGLEHPNILPIYEVGETEDGRPFFSMKFAAGGSLSEAAQNLRQDPRRIVQMMAKVSLAVQHGHLKGILHRDLNPGNILLDDRGEPLVSDFGLAKCLDAASDLTRTLTSFGTPGYIAPEQVQGCAKNVTAAADIYGLGAILFYLLTGRPPFIGKNVLAVIKQAGDEPAPKLRTISPEFDRDLEAICAKSLEREPQARYASAGDLAEDLERWLAGHPVLARPVSPPVRLWLWSRRNPVVAGMAALLLLLATLLGVIISKGGVAIRPPATRGIAVLPFESLTSDHENAFFADGVYDGVSAKLAKLANLQVISRNSVAKYRGAHNTQKIGRALNVAYVLDGTVRRSAGRIHVNVQLIDTRNNSQVWAEKYDRDVNDVFTLQSEIAEKVADHLGANLSSSEEAAMQEPPTTDLVAYDAYLQAKQLIGGSSFSSRAKKDLIQAIQLLEKAVARDASFAQAYCKLTEAHDRMYFLGFDHTVERLQLAETTLESVRRLRPGSGEMHLALAQHLYWTHGDYERAEAELAIAQRTLPNEARIPLLAAYIDRHQGEWEQSLAQLKEALRLDPRNLSILQRVSETYEALHQYEDMARTLDAALAIAPQDVASRVHRAWIDLESRADPNFAHAAIDEVLAEDPNAAPVISNRWLDLGLRERDPIFAERALSALPVGGCYEENIPFPNSWCEGLIARLRGDERAARTAFSTARKELEQKLRHQPDYAAALCAIGVIDAALGNKADAIKEGERAVELVPVSKNAIEGSMFVQYLAMIYAWTGEKDRAIERLAEAAKLPGSHVSYGYLRLHPLWDPLRGDPRFEAIVASLAPN
jgi:serine/threonine protein kinase/Tfp pilus assembly protein PilF